MTTRKEKLEMKHEQFTIHHQQECKRCSRFTILKTPCRPEACIFRQKEAGSLQ
ncbi:hypothetical protein KBA41_03745 [Candidatus Ozemobacteraceae bacterium]|nr:hypothetical protein [Candidatus Ozemobacteraceae bacterium]OQA05386.1 MAG: hypothetical protein BWY66_02526 [bacterium ADurb.Bin374]